MTAVISNAQHDKLLIIKKASDLQSLSLFLNDLWLRLLEKGMSWVAYAEDYGAFHTSTVVDIVDNGDDLCIETANTKYFLKKL